MKSYYSIGETARLLGISPQTLRYYDRIGLISPVFVSPHNGYRYYSFSQFHYLDRIKYLQKLGMSLKDISEVIQSGNVALLNAFLEKKLEETREEARKLQEREREIQWYREYFSYMEDRREAEPFYIRHFEERSILQVPCHDSDSTADMEIRLASLKGTSTFNNLEYLRQYGYRLDAEKAPTGFFYPCFYFIFLKGRPPFSSSFFATLPAGDYLCFRTRLLKEQWQLPQIPEQQRIHPLSGLIVALEFEDNLTEYADAMYEIQIRLTEKEKP